MFKDADEDFLDAIVSMFSYEVFLEGDVIINTHTRGSTMYFIQHGEAQIINRNGQVVRVLVDGDYFGGTYGEREGGTYGERVTLLGGGGRGCLVNQRPLYSKLPLIQPPLSRSVLIRGVTSFQGGFVIQSMKWPFISGVLIREITVSHTSKYVHIKAYLS